MSALETGFRPWFYIAIMPVFNGCDNNDIYDLCSVLPTSEFRLLRVTVVLTTQVSHSSRLQLLSVAAAATLGTLERVGGASLQTRPESNKVMSQILIIT